MHVYAAGKCERLVATGDPDYPPFLWRDPQHPDRLIGAAADLLMQMAQPLELTVDLLYAGSRDQATEEVISGRMDMLLGLNKDAVYLDQFDYIAPAYAYSPIVPAIRRDATVSDVAQLPSLNGGYVADHGMSATTQLQAESAFNLHSEPNITEALQQLRQQAHDYLLYAYLPLRLHSERMGIVDDIGVLSPALTWDGLYLTISRDSACNDAWLRGEMTKRMHELVDAGIPDRLIRLHIDRWLSQHNAQPTVQREKHDE